MEWSDVTTAITNLGSVTTSVINTIADSAYLMAFLAAPLMAAGIRVVKKLIRVAR